MSQPEHPDHTTPDGAQYPTDNIVALFESREAAEATKAELLDSGFAEGDITLFHGEEGLREIESHQTPLTRLREALDRLTQDAGVDRDLYMDGLRRGHSLLEVYAPDDATVDRVRPVLQAHGALRAAALHRFTFEPL